MLSKSDSWNQCHYVPKKAHDFNSAVRCEVSTAVKIWIVVLWAMSVVL
jgi:hypothetical protein